MNRIITIIVGVLVLGAVIFFLLGRSTKSDIEVTNIEVQPTASMSATLTPTK